MGSSDRRRKDVIVLSIRPEFADQIYSREKPFELRKPGIPTDLRYVLLFETGDRKLTGGFAVGEVHEGNPEEIWDLVKGGTTPKDRFERYYEGNKEARAIEIRRPEKLDSPVPESTVEGLMDDLDVPPQFSFFYAPDALLSELRSELEGLDDLLSETAGRQIGDWVGPSFRDIREEEHQDFREMVSDYIGKRYADIDHSFADHILESHEAGEDPVGYFTKRKHVFSIEQNGALLGYVVTTWKRGGSVKFGPTLIKEEHQKQGLAPQIRARLDDHLRGQGVRKTYSTIPDDHTAAYKYLISAGHMVEGHLARHYSRDHGELVFGKLLRSPEDPNLPPPPDRVREEPTEIIDEIRDFSRFADFVLDRMEPWYAGIDEDFVRSIYDAADRYPAEDLSKKAKKVFIAENDGDILACVVCTIKRGGAAKLAPFLTKTAPNLATDLLDQADEWANSEGLRKLYSLIPVLDPGLYQAFRSHSYEGEAHLREPYRPGIDMLVLSKFLTPNRTEEDG